MARCKLQSGNWKAINKAVLAISLILILNCGLILSQQYFSDVSSLEKLAHFSETFENNQNNWITDNNWINSRIANGSMNITCKNYKLSTGLSYLAVPVDYSRDFEIEASLQIVRGTGAVIFGMNEDFDHYRVELTDKDQFLFIRNLASRKKIEKLMPATSSSNIKSGSYNIITIRKLKNTYYLFINETLAGQFEKISPDGNFVGFNVGLDSEISVDFLKISYFNDRSTPVFADSKDTGKSLDNQTSGPQIVWVSPTAIITPLESYSGRVKTNIKSPSGLKSVMVYLNGVSKGEAEPKLIPDQENIFSVEKLIDFSPGENIVYMVATDGDGVASRSESRTFVNPNAIAPVITWSNPYSPAATTRSEKFDIEVCIKTPTDLKSIRVFVNGEPQGEANAFQPSPGGDCNYIWRFPVFLRNGENSIYVSATNAAGSTPSEKRTLKLLAATNEKRLALVIGNSLYSNKNPLKNPENDANLIEATLKDLGFDFVIKRVNAGKEVMYSAIREFIQKLPEYDVSLFFYAGHGNQVEGINYMIPTDARLEDKSACKYEAIRVDFLLEEFKKYPDKTNIVILDACRDNPYASWSRGSESGFVAMTCTSGTIIAFATAAGATASDGQGANGLYTEELVKQMAVSQPIESVFRRTRVQVRTRSNGAQEPAEYSCLNDEFYFVK
ncbi:MAG: caspase family protein [Bacteroidales bacterium]|nr:caspase family protein [Bacteroidales bacterium]